ncbi:MAG: carboxypeptidase regulatory-like domain-containing protein [Acidobacteriota bacterium]
MRLRVPVRKCVLVYLAALLLCSPAVYAQGGGSTASLSGVVTDSSGGVLPGANVVVKNNATAAEYPTVTDPEGRFAIPALNPGTYTVTVSLMGFKTFVAPDVQVITATPASVRVTLELGELSETVVVTGATEIVQTQTASVQTTIAVQQISSLPLTTRTALDFVTTLPGALTTGSNSRGTTINGLPTGSINITLDGVNVQDNNNRSGDGFFMMIRPLMDSVEEITVSTSTPGAESAGQGSAQIRMTTRAGSNRFSGSVYDTWRNQAGTNDDDVLTRTKKRGWLWRLNTPYWFNKRDRPKTAAGDNFIDDVRLETPGFRVGGPIARDKLFYFFNWEWFKWPNQVARTRYLMNQNAQQGIFTYTGNDGVQRTINLLTLAAANGQTSTIDPTMAKLFADIRSAATGFTGGALSPWNLNTDKFDYSPGGDQFRHFPTGRVDYNITRNHRFTGTIRFNRFESDPDILNSAEPRFPGFTNYGGQWSNRYSWTAALRSTFGRNLVNEARYGFAGATVQFFTNVTKDTFTCTDAGCTGGFFLNLLDIGGTTLTAPAPVNGPSTRHTPDIVYEDTLTWLKGKHTFTMGGSYTHIYGENWNANQLAPSISFGTASTDPAYAMLSTSANYPGGLSTTQQGYARNLYALLTGRVSQVAGSFYQNAAGEYVYLGDRVQQFSIDMLGLFISDSWRLRPNLTLTGGVRWELQFPFKPDSSSYARLEDWRMVYGLTGEGNLFKPGTMTGTGPRFVQYAKGDHPYTTDWNNVAPSVGVVWRPNLGSGVLAKILSADPVIRGGYSVSYEREGFTVFTNIYGSNPGASRAGTRSITLGTLGTDGLPVLLRQPDRLGPPATPSLEYPFAPATNETVRAFDPGYRVPYTHQYSVGIQRELGRNMALEVRYIGNTSVGFATSWDINNSANWNILENGFYDEFRRAQANLRANIAAGLGNTFAFTGAAGTAPLPIFQAYFAGIPLSDARNQTPTTYTSANYRSSSWYNQLAIYNPSLTGIAGTGTSGLQNSARAANAAAAGLPANFFQANPSVYQSSAQLQMNGGNTRYNAIQVDLRRRMSNGLLVQGSYNYGVRNTWSWPSLRESWHSVPSTVGPDHALKFNWVYELPFGHGKRFGSGVSRWVDAIIGGWEFDGVARFQSGPKFNIGGLTLVGMTAKDVQDMFKFYRRTDANGVERVYMFPEDVIANSIIAFSQTSATSLTGYSGALPTGRYFTRRSTLDCVAYLSGDCGAPEVVIITAPWYGKTDFSFVKRFRLGGNRFIEARMDLYNVFDNINFTPIGVSTGSSTSNWEVTSAARDLNASQDAGGRITSFGLRFTW